MDDPDLLYEDLFEDLEDGKSVIKTSFHEMEDRMKNLSNEAEELRLQVRNLQEQKEGLSKQNEVLIRNISCLFKTAQMEISRKDKQIKSLQEESRKNIPLNSGSPASTASGQAAVVKDKPYLTSMTIQGEGKTGEACTTSDGTGKRGVRGGKHGDYAIRESHRGSNGKVGEKPGETILACNGAWKQNNHSDAQRDCVALDLQTDSKGVGGKIPLSFDGIRRQVHHRNGHQIYATTMTSEANLKGRIKETPGGSEKQSHYEDDHCDYAIKTSQENRHGASGDLLLASDGLGKGGKSVHLELQGGHKGGMKEACPESVGSGKPGHRDDNHSECTTMASRADCKGVEKETFLTSSGMESGDHRRDDHCDYSEKRRSCGKSSELLDEMWKRRRQEGEYVAAANEYHRRRADERYPLDSKRGERAINAHRPSDAHRASERREKRNRL